MESARSMLQKLEQSESKIELLLTMKFLFIKLFIYLELLFKFCPWIISLLSRRSLSFNSKNLL